LKSKQKTLKLGYYMIIIDDMQNCDSLSWPFIFDIAEDPNVILVFSLRKQSNYSKPPKYVKKVWREEISF
jgi:hypothetical protein